MSREVQFIFCAFMGVVSVSALMCATTLLHIAFVR